MRTFYSESEMFLMLQDSEPLGNLIPKGSESLPVSTWCRVANAFLPWMLAASLPHDIWWGIKNDGTRETFERSNNEWKDTCYKLADDSFGWIPFKGIRDTLRNARKFEARRGWKILMDDDRWKVFQESAQVEEGPEVQDGV